MRGIRLKLNIPRVEAFESNGCSFLHRRLQHWLEEQKNAFKFVWGEGGCSGGGGGRSAMAVASPADGSSTRNCEQQFADGVSMASSNSVSPGRKELAARGSGGSWNELRLEVGICAG